MKAQASGAGTKRLKAAILLEHMDKLVNQFDMTYYLSVKIATRLIGRAIDRNKLFERYATTGREADKKTADIAPERFELITQSAPYIECENDLNEAYCSGQQKPDAFFSEFSYSTGDRSPAAV